MSTKISCIQETRRGRYALFCEGEFLFSVDGETLAQYGVEEGVLLDGAALAALRDSSDTRRAKDQALRYLSQRAHGEAELYEKLCRRYDPPTAAAAMADLKELELLDDRQFAAEKARSLAARHKSNGEIYRKLIQIGIDREIARQAADTGQGDDRNAALRILEKGGYIEKLRRGEVPKVMAALARRGFTHADVRWAIEAVMADYDEAAEEQY